MSGPANTGGLLYSGWPGDATATLQKGAEGQEQEDDKLKGGSPTKILSTK